MALLIPFKVCLLKITNSSCLCAFGRLPFVNNLKVHDHKRKGSGISPLLLWIFPFPFPKKEYCAQPHVAGYYINLKCLRLH